MNLVESFRIAIRALGSNKVRAALTMLGVIIGVAAVILLVGIGTGVQGEITGQIEGLGSNLLFAFPGNLTQGGGGGPGGATQIQKRFTLADADNVTRRVGDLGLVVPVVQGPVSLKVGNRTQQSSVAAGNQFSSQVFSSKLLYGNYYTQSDYVTASRVVMLGATPANELFPNQNPVGRTVAINGQQFTVIAVLAKQGGTLSGDQDNQVYMPTTTAQQLLGTQDISSIIVRANNPDQINVVKAQIEQTLRPGFGTEFTVFTQQQTLGILSSLLGTLTFMLAGLAGISLLVGGIGIMNIMLVSVSERTREIGIRKAVGARTYDILSQFVIEAVVLSVLGGAVGILIGWAGAAAINRWVPTQITLWAVGLAFFFSAAVGIFFGVYPAWKASRLNPIDALRYE